MVRSDGEAGREETAAVGNHCGDGVPSRDPGHAREEESLNGCCAGVPAGSSVLMVLRSL